MLNELNDGLSALFDRLRRESGTEIETITRDRLEKGDVPFVVIDNGRKLLNAADIVSGFEKTQDVPFRRKGVYQAADVASLIAWMAKHAPEDAPVFGAGVENLNGEWRNPKLSLVGIGNYSDADKAKWHDFRVRYDFPVSHAWNVWAEGHSDEDKPNWFDQANFAEFIESHIHDLSEPQRNEKLSEAVNRFLEATGAKDFAKPADMFKMSRELKIYASEKIETKIDLQSGEARVQYSEEHAGQGGRPLKIPQLFYIRIPVFFGQDPVLIGVKLRYRNAGGGKVVWSYALFAPDIIVADEFEKACAIVRNTARPVYLGVPDSQS